MAFTTQQKPIRNILGSMILTIPRNQRTYVWDKNNWYDLFYDIDFAVSSGRKCVHFIGSIVLKSEGVYKGLDKCIIIDGQQRIVTISLLLLALMKSFSLLGDYNSCKGLSNKLLYLDTSNNKGCILCSENYIVIHEIVNLLLECNDCSSIEEKLRNTIFWRKEDRKLRDAFCFFNELINSKVNNYSTTADKLDYLTRLRDCALEVQSIEVVADTEEDSYTIFEILNARGQALEEHELIKNYIMRYTHPYNEVDSVKIKWREIEQTTEGCMARFFKHYTTHKVGATSKDNIYRSIQKFYTKDKTADLINDLVIKANYYARIVGKVETEDKSILTERYVFAFLKKYRAEQFRPVFLSLMHAYQLRKITHRTYIRIIENIYKFYISYNIVGEENSNKLEDIIYKYAETIENDFSESVLNDFIIKLTSKLPSRDAFIKKFLSIGYSKHSQFYKSSKNKRRAQIILELYEMHMTKRECIGEFSIEHIMSDSASDASASIGNLTLLEFNLNEGCKDKLPFNKVDQYRLSSFLITRNLADEISKWNTTSIEKRAQRIASIFYDEILRIHDIEKL